MLNLRELNIIKIERQMIVYGFIHRFESKNKQEIPEGIILVCVLFYGNGADEWDLEQISDYMTLSDRTITQSENHLASSYCKNIIESGIFSWKFRIEDNSNGTDWEGGGKFMIGIWKVKDKEPVKDTYFTRGGGVKGYGFEPNGAILTNDNGNVDDALEYVRRCRKGIVIEMILNLDELVLSFKIDGEDYGKAFDVEGCKYRAAVYMLEKNDSITLLR